MIRSSGNIGDGAGFLIIAADNSLIFVKGRIAVSNNDWHARCDARRARTRPNRFRDQFEAEDASAAPAAATAAAASSMPAPQRARSGSAVQFDSAG